MSQISAVSGGGSGTSPVLTLTGNTGGAVGPTTGNINIVGSGGTTVAGNAGTSTLTITVAGSMSYTEVTGTTQAMAVNNGYIANNAGVVTLTLPATAAVGDAVAVVGKGTGGWSIAQNSGQTIHMLSSNTTTGVGGSLASTVRYDCVTLRCTTANTDWVVQTCMGNLTVT